MVHLFNMKDVSVFLFPLAETLSLDCNSTVMVQEVAGGEDRVPRLPLLAVLILLLLGLVVAVVLAVVEGGRVAELHVGSRWDLVQADLVACSNPCCVGYNTWCGNSM